ncbi:uncharacterized protein [Aegilops tauschii subsp. strangulata]|uniref:uncharacterized protein isoform X3 n=1 Tax=Aegilops tauschii subsp. strangulata TaxID=200361 RepID=UPI001ABC7F4C|nr:uncharacterized protein LOC109782437 isoform X3 [Aegilops tauschii subsp. strangulata]
MVNHGKEKARFLLSICSPTAAAFPELGELELSLPVVDLLSAMLPASPDHPLSLSRDSLPGAAAPAQPKAAGRSYAAARSLPPLLGDRIVAEEELALVAQQLPLQRARPQVRQHQPLFHLPPIDDDGSSSCSSNSCTSALEVCIGRVIAFLTGAPDYEDGQLDTKRYGEQYASKGEDVDLMLLPEQIPSYRDLPKAIPPISELGPDALREPMQLDDFVQSFGRKMRQ